MGGLLERLASRDSEADLRERNERVARELEERRRIAALQETVSSIGFGIILAEVEKMSVEAVVADPASRIGVLSVHNYLLRLAASRKVANG